MLYPSRFPFHEFIFFSFKILFHCFAAVTTTKKVAVQDLLDSQGNLIKLAWAELNRKHLLSFWARSYLWLYPNTY